MSSRLAIVTGANKGIGYGIVKLLINGTEKFPKFDGIVYLTSRNESLGKEAVEKLKKEIGNIESLRYHQLDISNDESIKTFCEHIKEGHPTGIDILVNNAGIAFKQSSTEPMHIQASQTIKTNYFSTKRFCDTIFPQLKDGCRVVNMSSSAGLLSWLKTGTKAHDIFSSDTLTFQQVDDALNDYIKRCEGETWRDIGFSQSMYVMSKIGVSAMSRIQQRMMNESGRDICVVHVHPGYVDTDMTSNKGPLTIEEGSQSTLFGVHHPNRDELKGSMVWKDCKIVDWKTFMTSNF